MVSKAERIVSLYKCLHIA